MAIRSKNPQKEEKMRIKKVENLFLIRFDEGEELILGLSTIAKDKGIKAGAFSGIGTLKDPIIGYFEKREKDYKRQTFRGEYELLLFYGNISWHNDEPIVHAHAVISGENLLAFGGHVFSAPVSVTAEVFLTPLSQLIERKENPLYNLKLLEF